MSERAIHKVQAAVAGVACARQVLFAGQVFRLRKPALAPLLAYMHTVAPPPDPAQVMIMAGGSHPSARQQQEESMAAMAAVHRLLEASIKRADFLRLQEVAVTARVHQPEVTSLLCAVVEEQIAWKFYPGMRLLGFIAATLPERDGELIRAGLSLAGLTPRQACNMAYALLLSGHQTAEDRDQFIDDLHFEGNPDAEALKRVREMQAAKREAAGG